MKKTLLSLILSAVVVPVANADLYIDNVDAASTKAIKTNTVKALKKEIEAQSKKTNTQVKQIQKVDTVQYDKLVSVFKNVGEKQAGQVVDGFANNIHLETALAQVIPSDFTTQFKKGVDKQKSVSWKGGKAWNRVLEDMSRDNFSAIIDWNTKVVTVYPMEMSKFDSKITTTVKNPVVKAKPAQPKVVAKPVQVKAKPVQIKAVPAPIKSVSGKTWILNNKYTLRENVEMWGKKAGWTVVWKAPDYRVVANTQLTGEIDSENGPVISILKLYEDATLPLKVSIYGSNKVISVEGRLYQHGNAVDVSGGIQ